MLGKPSGQMGFGDLEARGRVPEGHFLKKIDSQIDWRPFLKLLEPLYHPTQGRPSHPPVMMFIAFAENSFLNGVKWVSRESFQGAGFLIVSVAIHDP
ncbi:MAG: hypothetical protein ACYC6G_19825 [Desulfobaccales bacterium]